MLGDIRQAQNVYIVTGYTDMRKGLRSLVPYVMQNFKMDPYDRGLFLFYYNIFGTGNGSQPYSIPTRT